MIDNAKADGLAGQGGPCKLTAQEAALIDGVEKTLEGGRQLKQWWAEKHASDSFREKFELVRSFNRPEDSFGFFDKAPVDAADMPVMGNYQAMYYDKPKSRSGLRSEAASWTRDQLREFVLRYFMRVSDYREPATFAKERRTEPPELLRPISWCPEDEGAQMGFGFSQLLYKQKGSGQIGRFPQEERDAIVDLREIGEKYEWIITKVRVFDFNIELKLLGSGRPFLTVPLSEVSYLVTSREFISDENDPASGVLGRYGLGYAFLKSPGRSLIAYGPGEFEAAFQTIDFQILKSGQIRTQLAFVANRPTQILDLSFNPMDWGLSLADFMSFGMASRMFSPMRDMFEPLSRLGEGLDPVLAFILAANLATGGQAAQQLCISKERLEKDFLVQHFRQHYQTILGSLYTWRQIPNWLDKTSLPDWVKSGASL